ncbi:MAG: hydratase [Clostridiales bacterium]|nr:hydratase [Clostridiales bacterium]
MIRLTNKGVFVHNGRIASNYPISLDEAKQNTLAYRILRSHNESGDAASLKIKFDALASHDITYVNIIQTARASGLEAFPVPYALTNCHNSLCAVGGTINEDDHLFGLTCAKRYGGIFVPAHFAVIHQYMREMYAGCGKMILGSDSHTRYGALGTMGIGEGGGELVKQVLSKTYDIPMPQIVGVKLRGKPQDGVGPQDIALVIIKAVFKNGFVKNKVMEFFGDGIKNLGVDFRNGIDVMTTETTCLSSIWETDEAVEQYLAFHKRQEDYKELRVTGTAFYDGLIEVDLSAVEPMIALPFHPSNAFKIKDINEDILRQAELECNEQLEGARLNLTDKFYDGRLHADQGVIAGCAGGTGDNLREAANILRGQSIGNDLFSLSIYPASQPVNYEITRNGIAAELLSAGATMRSAFCGPCFGAGDVPFNNGLSIRHTTRNFANREGSKPTGRQIASVALMDARSIAASAINGGKITPATEIESPKKTFYLSYNYAEPRTFYDKVYRRVYDGFGKPDKSVAITQGPNIADWPEFYPLPQHVLLFVASVLNDPVTTTDELIPSGESSSYRSNPIVMSDFTLSRKDPGYVPYAKSIRDATVDSKVDRALKYVIDKYAIDKSDLSVASVIVSRKPGDGSAREQAASCQRVLGGRASICQEYATKRYRSNLINWGLLPFTCSESLCARRGDFIFIPNVRASLENGEENVTAYLGGNRAIELSLGYLAREEREIILAGCLMNYYREMNMS